MKIEFNWFFIENDSINVFIWHYSTIYIINIMQFYRQMDKITGQILLSTNVFGQRQDGIFTRLFQNLENLPKMSLIFKISKFPY